jgi:hypothetical protein
MIFVDTTEGKAITEEFAYTNNLGSVELVCADKNSSSVSLYGADEHLRDSLSDIFYEDIPKLILALQAAYDFKFKGDA